MTNMEATCPRRPRVKPGAPYPEQRPLAATWPAAPHIRAEAAAACCLSFRAAGCWLWSWMPALLLLGSEGEGARRRKVRGEGARRRSKEKEGVRRRREEE